jgi:hypothetical protein
MNMNPENQDFESLRRLLKLKRHELPPPRYFNEFPGQVLQRIKLGEGRSRSGREVTWIERLISIFEGKPMLAGGLGAAVCALLLVGLAYSERMDPPPGASELGGGLIQASGQLPAPALGGHSALAASSTNPVTGPSIFDALVRTPTAYPASLRPSGQ